MVCKASCCCGDLSIEVNAEPVINAICHCSNCQCRSGSAFGWSVYFDKSAIVKLPHETGLYEIKGKNEQQRHFCESCGTTLFWYAECFDGLIGIAGGCFPKNEISEPTLTVCDENQRQWGKLPEYWNVEN